MVISNSRGSRRYTTNSNLLFLFFHCIFQRRSEHAAELFYQIGIWGHPSFNEWTLCRSFRLTPTSYLCTSNSRYSVFMYDIVQHCYTHCLWRNDTQKQLTACNRLKERTLYTLLPGGGSPQSFVQGGSAPRSNLLPLYIPFWQKSTPFIHLPLKKWYPLDEIMNYTKKEHQA